MPIEYRREIAVFDGMFGDALFHEFGGQVAFFFRARVTVRPQIEHDEHLHLPRKALEGAGRCLQVCRCDHVAILFLEEKGATLVPTVMPSR